VPNWANELADATSSPNSLEDDLWHYLHEDVINGLLDDAGPLINGTHLGLRFIDSSGRGVHVDGQLLFLKMRLPFREMGKRILVAKEAVLDFARRHGVPPPSWWSDDSRGENQPSRSPGQLKDAPERIVIEAIRCAYDAAEDAGRKPPNIKELPAEAQPFLQQKGFYSSGRQIMRLGVREEFNGCRRLPGKTVASERRKK
jgi:hypothetical protein